MTGYARYSLLWGLGFALVMVAGLFWSALIAGTLGASRWEGMSPLGQGAWALFLGLFNALLPLWGMKWVVRLEALLLVRRGEFLEFFERQLVERASTEEEGLPREAVHRFLVQARRLVYSVFMVFILLWSLLVGVLVGLGMALLGESPWAVAYAVALLFLAVRASRVVRFLGRLLRRPEASKVFAELGRLPGLMPR